MNLRPLALVLVLAASPVAAERGPIVVFVDGLSLVALCRSRNAEELGYCFGYLTSALDTSVLDPSAPGFAPACYPRSMSTEQLWTAFMAWVQLNRGELHRAGASVARQALSDLWPCEKRPS